MPILDLIDYSNSCVDSVIFLPPPNKSMSATDHDICRGIMSVASECCNCARYRLELSNGVGARHNTVLSRFAIEFAPLDIASRSASVIFTKRATMASWPP